MNMKKILLFLAIILFLYSCEVQYRSQVQPPYYYDYYYYYPISVYGGYRSYRIPEYHYNRPQMEIRGRRH